MPRNQRRCKLCGQYNSPTAYTCSNVRCGADLALYGEIELDIETGQSPTPPKKRKRWPVVLAVIGILLLLLILLLLARPDSPEPPDSPTAETQPATTAAVQTDPPHTDPPQTDPPQTDPPQTDPPQTDPPQTDPPQTDPPQTDPPQTDPPQTDPPQTSPPAADGPWVKNLLKSDFNIHDCILKRGANSPFLWEFADHVIFVDNLSGAQDIRLDGGPWDVSEAQDGSVLAWFGRTHLDGRYICDYDCEYILYIGAEGGVNASLACASLFADCSEIVAIDFNGCFHTDGAQSMEKMFYNCTALKELDLTGFNTSSVTNMSNMLYGLNRNCNLTVDLNTFDTDQVTVYDNFMYYGFEINGVPWTDLFK